MGKDKTEKKIVSDKKAKKSKKRKVEEAEDAAEEVHVVCVCPPCVHVRYSWSCRRLARVP